jgi:hypothetical protein
VQLKDNSDNVTDSEKTQQWLGITKDWCDWHGYIKILVLCLVINDSVS